MKRCKVGQRLHLKWTHAVQTATMGTWQRVMFGPRDYDKHRAKCARCQQADIKAGEK